MSHANHARGRDAGGNRGGPQSLFRTRAGIRARRTAASHNAVDRGVCDDQRVRTTVLIVDDHQPFRESASALLESEGFAVVGAAADGAAALDAIERLRPEVVLISSREAAAYGPRLTAAPARGFLPKRELSGAALAALVG